jgi:hypothetical protein
MPFRKAAAATATAIVVAMTVSLSSCSRAHPHPAASSPAKSPVESPVRQDKAHAYSAAIAEVKDYLAVWHQQGDRAAQRFLVPASGPEPPPIILKSGKVVSYRPYRWVSQDNFTLFVNLDLHFAGFPSAWNSGLNSRFITFTRRAGQRHYLMYFTTSP